MNFLAFWIIGMSIIGLSLAEEENPSANQVGSSDAVQGRSCHDCHAGDGYETEKPTSVIYENPHHDLSWLWGMSGVALSLLPILAVNIVGVVLLAILLKSIGEPAADPIAYYQPAYAPAPTSYQSYDGGAYSKSGVASSFTKRSTDKWANFPSHSTLQFLTNVIGDAIEKYNNIDAAEE